MTHQAIIQFISDRAKNMDSSILTPILPCTLDDLGFDSLDKIELFTDLSDTTGIDIKDNEMSLLKTVEDVVNYFAPTPIGDV